MTDLDTLRRALRASARPEPAFDPAEIISRGRRLRWRRRAVAAGSGVCLAAAVFGAVVGVGRLTGPPPAPSHHTVTPIGPVGASARPRPVPSPTTPGAVRARARPSSEPAPTTLPGAPNAIPGDGAAASATPTASASSASGIEPSATPTGTR